MPTVANPYDPDPNDAREWMYSNESWPAQDWDIFLANGHCDNVLLDCARDSQCPNQAFALHCLYFVVGDVVHSESSLNRQQAVFKLLNFVTESDSMDLITWRDLAKSLLNGELEFDYDFWCQHGF